MKRKGNLYQELYKFENIVNAYKEVCSHTKNKKKVRNYKEFKAIYISRIYNVLKSETKERLNIKNFYMNLAQYL